VSVNVDTILQVASDEIVFSAPLDDREACEELLGSLGIEWSMRADLGKVSLIGGRHEEPPGHRGEDLCHARGHRRRVEGDLDLADQDRLPRGDRRRAARRSPRCTTRSSWRPRERARPGSASSERRAPVGTVTLGLLAQRGYTDVRAFASSRSAGRIGRVRRPRAFASRRRRRRRSPPATSTSSSFSVGTSASRELVPHAVRGGAVAVDKSAASYRLEPGIPLVVPEVNGARALANDGIVANPNCCTIPLTCVLQPLHDAAGLARVRVATYQSVSGAGARPHGSAPDGRSGGAQTLRWTGPGEGDETEEESKIRAETRKIMELPDLPLSATTVRVPVLVGHAEAVWIELERPLSAEEATALLRALRPSVTVVDVPTPGGCGPDRHRARRAHPPRSGVGGTDWRSSSRATT